MHSRALAAMAALLLASCGSVGLQLSELKPYRIEIQQGNFVSQEAVSRLKLGMSKDQVRFVLGTPLITDSFHADRWDYVYRRQRANSRELEQRKIAVFFEHGKLKRIDGDVMPAVNAGAAAVKAPEAQQAPAESLGRTSADAAKPAQVPPEQEQAQEKSWWERLKDKIGF